MSRIEEWECFTLDVEWYAVDRSGNIAVFLSAGNGNLPEFVCADYDKLDSIATYFDALPKNTESFNIVSITEHIIAQNIEGKKLEEENSMYKIEESEQTDDQSKEEQD